MSCSAARSAARITATDAARGDVDFGSAGLTDAFFVLANQGALKVIGEKSLRFNGIWAPQSFPAGDANYQSVGAFRVRPMRVATAYVLIATIIIGAFAVPERGTARGSMTFAMEARQAAKEHADARVRSAKHRFAPRKQRLSDSLAFVPFDDWDDAAVPIPAPEAPADGVPSATIPSVQLPACHETINGVTIFRGRPCRT